MQRQLETDELNETGQLRSAPPDRGLPVGLKRNLESASGIALDDVRVHYDSPRPRQLGALAFAQGSDIFVGPGQEHHLPHEAWHVVQQAQGRVQPTARSLQAPTVQLNDDIGLEREAAMMGAGATTAAGPAGTTQAPASRVLVRAQPGTDASHPIQAIMAVAEFQAATPAGFLKPRDTVTAIDTALATYIQTRTAANAGALILVIQHYLTGNHDAGRLAVAQQLLTRATAERDLLQQIGNQNAFLIDGLIAQADIGRIAALIQLATDATAANATVLPLLIATIDETNINNLNMSGLVTAVGAAHVPLLPVMITQSGGMTEVGRLTTVVNRHAGNGALAFDLTREAAGNAAEFQRLATEVPSFQRAAAPPALPGVAAAVLNYNNARLPALVAALTNLAADAVTAHGLAGPLGVNGVLLGNVNNRIGTVQGRVVALGLPGAVGVPQDVADALALRNIVCNALNNAVNARGVPIPAAFGPAVAGVNTANLAVAAAQPAPAILNVSGAHFLERHTANFFDFGDIKLDNTQWPAAWGAGADNQVATNFIGVLNALSAAGNWLMPGVPIPNVACLLGCTVQIAALAAPGVNLINVGQFFPNHAPANGVYDHPGNTMRAIHKVV